MTAIGGESSALTLEQAIDLLETVLVYKLPRLFREEIRTMLHLPGIKVLLRKGLRRYHLASFGPRMDL
jgi:predicted transposase YdaD